MLSRACTPEVLVAAYRVCKRSAAPRERASFERDWPGRMAAIQTLLRSGRMPSSRGRRRFSVRRADGTLRHIEAASLEEAIAQRAILDVMTPSLERNFLASSFAYRPGRDRVDAALAVSAWIDRGHGYAFQTDIAACFDELDHGRLRVAIRRLVRDRAAANLLSDWLDTVGTRTCAGRWPVRRRRTIGIPQGAVLSPLLANIYLHELDCACARARLRYARYGDDIIVAARSEATARSAGRRIAREVHRMGLRLADEKTRVSRASETIFLGMRLPVTVDVRPGPARAFAATTYFLRRKIDGRARRGMPR